MIFNKAGFDIKHLVYVPIGHMVLKIDVPCKNFHFPANICTSPVKLMYTAVKKVHALTKKSLAQSGM